MKTSERLSDVRGYYLLLALRLISAVVLWLDFTSIFANIAFYWQASPFQIGVASAVYGLPGLVLGPAIGQLADRWGPYRVLALSYALRGITSVLLFTAPSIELFIVGVFLKGIANLGAMPAEQLLIKGMLNQEQIVSNAGLMTAVDQGVKILAPLAISVLAAWWAPNLGFAISFVIAAVGLAAVAILKLRYAVAPPDGPASTARESFATLKVMVIEDVFFRIGLCASLLQSFVLGLYDPMLTIILKHQGLNSGAFGIVVSATALGALIGAILFKRVFKREGGLSLIALSLSGFGASVFIPGLLGMLGHHLPLLGFAILWIVNGLCYALTAMNFAVILQMETPRSQIGTVSSTIRSVQLLFLVTAPLAGSAFAAHFGVNTVFAFCGAMTLFFAAGLGWWSSIQKFSPSPKA